MYVAQFDPERPLSLSEQADDFMERECGEQWLADSISALLRGEDVTWSVREGLCKRRQCGVKFADLIEAVENHNDFLGDGSISQRFAKAAIRGFGPTLRDNDDNAAIRQDCRALAAKCAEGLLLKCVDDYVEYLRQEDEQNMVEARAGI